MFGFPASIGLQAAEEVDKAFENAEKPLRLANQAFELQQEPLGLKIMADVDKTFAAYEKQLQL